LPLTDSSSACERWRRSASLALVSLPLVLAYAHLCLLAGQCPSRGWKGKDPRRCYVTSDGRALVVADDAYLDVLDEPHDHFE
jgi:hypothetical protein